MMDKQTMPPLIHAGLMRYRDERTPVGGFLTMVLENDLAGAIGHADEDSYAALREILQWVWWEMPSVAWGSPDKVTAWLNREDDDDE